MAAWKELTRQLNCTRQYGQCVTHKARKRRSNNYDILRDGAGNVLTLTLETLLIKCFHTGKE
jgi:hypothetical protein